MDLKPCSKCSKLHSRAGRYCFDCHAAYMREWRKTHPLNEAHRKRDNARSYASTYKRRGLLTPKPCEICGSSESEMHHPDHELPLMVAWLCRTCHLDWHTFWRGVAADAWRFWTRKDEKKRRAA